MHCTIILRTIIAMLTIIVFVLIRNRVEFVKKQNLYNDIYKITIFRDTIISLFEAPKYKMSFNGT
jgi:hypothetical protein